MARAPAFVLLVILAVAPAAGLTRPNAIAHACADLHSLAFVGPVCTRPGGLIDVYSPDGQTRIMTTHGPDGAAEYPSPAVLNATPVPPVCVEGSPDDRYGVVIYVVPSDQTDRYNDTLPQLRAVVNQTNGDLLASAQVLGGEAQYKMLCQNGLVVVRHAVLTTTTNDTTVASMVGQLNATGLLSATAKYWMFYDDPTHTIPFHGLGSFCNDDRNVLQSCNNGGGFAISFGYLSDFVFMHEVGHNLGAVVVSAPNSSGGAHCNDGLDVMCYADGSGLSNYTNTTCSAYQWDCGHNDYFDPAPAPSSFLTTHWNLASRLDRFLQVGDINASPTVVELRCGAVNASLTCWAAATGPSNALAYRFQWPDGSVERVPEAGYLPSGTEVNRTHAAPSVATDYAVTLQALDATGQSSENVIFDPADVPPNAPPVIDSIVCPDRARPNEPVLCRLTTRDDGLNLTITIDDGAENSYVSQPVAPGARPFFVEYASDLDHLDRNVSLTVTATDDGSPALNASASRVIEILTPRPRCEDFAQGSLLVGLPGREVGGFSTAVVPLTPWCSGHSFNLTGSAWADLDICFQNDTADLLCYRHLGDEAGRVPDGATAARIILNLGVLANYDFEPDP